MRLYRICDTEFAHDPFSGLGGLYVPGRWHTRGTRIAYASPEQGTAMLEVLMNVLPEQLRAVPRSLVIAEIPDELVVALPRSRWPPRWAADVHDEATRAIGDVWVREAPSLGLLVPSAAASPPPFNVLVNPGHPEIAALRIERTEPIDFNARLGSAPDEDDALGHDDPATNGDSVRDESSRP